MSAPDLGELRRLLAAATPGPWDVVQSSRALGYFDVVAGATDSDIAPMVVPTDAELITATVNALPALLDEIEAGRRLRAGVEALADEWLSDGVTFGGDWPDSAEVAEDMCANNLRALLAETSGL